MNEKVAQALSHVEEKYIAQAARRRKRHYVRKALIAAVLALAFLFHIPALPLAISAKAVSLAPESRKTARPSHSSERFDDWYNAQMLRLDKAAAAVPAVAAVGTAEGLELLAVHGDAAVATQRVGSQIESISWNTADGFAAALNAFVGQNFGARKMDRVKKGYNISAVTVLIWGSAVMLLFLAFTDPITRIFFHEAEVIPISNSYLRIIGFSEPLLCVEIIAIAAISALGNTKLCSIISIVCTGMRIPLAFLLSRTALGLDGIWWAFTLTSIIKGIILHFAFRRESRRMQLKTIGG